MMQPVEMSLTETTKLYGSNQKTLDDYYNDKLRGVTSQKHLVVDDAKKSLEYRTLTIMESVFASVGTGPASTYAVLKLALTQHLKHTQLTSTLSTCVRGHLSFSPIQMQMLTNPNSCDSNWDSALHKASSCGLLEKVQELIAMGANPTMTNKQGYTPLHVAALCGHTQIVQFLITLHSNPSIKTNQGSTALHLAAFGGHMQTAEALLQSGLDANAQDDCLETALHIASKWGHKNVLSLLIRYGVDLQISNQDGFFAWQYALATGLFYHAKLMNPFLEGNGRTNLHTACELQSETYVQQLLAQGYNVHASDIEGKTALHIATQGQNTRIVELLLERMQGKTSDQDVNGNTALHIAAFNACQDIALLLIATSNIDLQNSEGDTHLHIACRQNLERVIPLLVKKSRSINSQNFYGKTALFELAVRVDVPHTELLLRRKADPLIADTASDTCLFYAIRNGYREMTRLYIEYGASINIPDAAGYFPLDLACLGANKELIFDLLKVGARSAQVLGFTPLHLLAQKGGVEILSYMVSRGFSLDAETDTGLTPLHIAALYGNADAIIFFLKYAPQEIKQQRIEKRDLNGNTPLHLAAKEGHLNSISALITQGANLSKENFDNKTPLELAVEGGKSEVVQAFIHHKASFGNSALHTACFKCSKEIVSILLASGSKIDAQDLEGKQPIHYATDGGHLEIIKLLTEQGASLTAQDKQGITPAHIACKTDNLPLLIFFVESGVDLDKTLLHTAASFGSKAIAQYLIEKKMPIDERDDTGKTPLLSAAASSQKDLFEALLAWGALFDAVDKRGKNVLHYASEHGNSLFMEFVLACTAEKQKEGVVLYETDAKARTPLHYAVRQGDVYILQLLLDFHFSIDAQDSGGLTALHYASMQGNKEAVRTLLQRRANCHITDRLGQTALHKASKQGNSEIALLLTEHDANLLLKQDTSKKTPLEHASDRGHSDCVTALQAKISIFASGMPIPSAPPLFTI
jgi:serine/threonine-protein phosphatase 6 regulatory ankyrin repeat subunit B